MHGHLLYSILFMVAKTIAIEENPTNSFLLPSSIIPIEYNLTIEPMFETIDNATFNGTIRIKAKVMEETNSITLHSQKLAIAEHDLNVVLSNRTTLNVTGTKINSKKDFYTLFLNRSLPQNETITICVGQFKGDLKLDDFGFYLAKYTELGKEILLALTDFQPTGARKAFPCFDEPAQKASFRISIIRKSSYRSFSNMKLIKTTYLGNDRYQDDYKETTPMSTYLVAFSVSNYESTVKNGRFQIHGPQELIREKKADYVLSITEDILATLENVTTVNYSFDKLDVFAVPSMYFQPGGMENWGLITISDDVFHSSDEFTVDDEQKYTMLCTHEIAHQWFGNLVTPSWWNYIWLSEGFSTYMEYHITSLMKPSWQMMNQFVVNIQQLLLENDRPESKSLNYNNTQHVKSLLSETAYYKGAVLLRMLEHVLTPDVFQLGFIIYLKKHQFSSVSSNDLYNAFQQAVDMNNNTNLGNMKVGEIMASWESQPGYPLVKIHRNYTNGSITISQCPYRSNEGKRYIWMIPLTYQCSKHKSPYFWLTNTSITIHSIPSSCSWMVFNIHQAGFYRVTYDLQNWHSITNFLKTTEFTDINPLNRAQLIDDAFELANNNILPYDVALNLSLYLSQETHYLPIKSFLKKMEKNVFPLIRSETQTFLVNYIERSLRSAYNCLSFDSKPSDTHIDSLNRISVITTLCSLGNKDCQEKSSLKFRNWTQFGSEISKELEFISICTSLKLGTTEDWYFVYDKFKAEKSGLRQIRLFTSLGCTRNNTLLNKFVDELLELNTNLSTSARIKALKKILYLDNNKAEMLLDYILEHPNVPKKMFQDIHFADIVCNAIVNYVYLFQLANSENLPKAIGHLCTHRINRNVALLYQPHFKIVTEWFRSNFPVM